MIVTEPQFLYLILTLPALFGITLIGEGINKILHQEWSGLVSVFFGIVFISMVVAAYFFFTFYVNK